MGARSGARARFCIWKELLKRSSAACCAMPKPRLAVSNRSVFRRKFWSPVGSPWRTMELTVPVRVLVLQNGHFNGILAAEAASVREGLPAERLDPHSHPTHIILLDACLSK